MGRTCAFCGTGGKLTGEHVFGDWLSGIGLQPGPVRHGAGPLNRSLREMGTGRAFTSKVRNVCGSCNHGWMSNLEAVAKRVLSPLVLGDGGSIEEEDAAAIAAWVQKTALVGMLVSSEQDRDQGYGLPAAEYRALYELREQVTPLPASHFWIGRHARGQRLASVWVTPMVVKVHGLPEPELPQAYVMSIVLGEVLLQGVRFTASHLQFDLEATEELERLWPSSGTVACPSGGPFDDEKFVGVSQGRNLVSKLPNVILVPWRAATELPASSAEGSMVRLPTPCGQHCVFYPAALAVSGMNGEYYAFTTSCECGKSYLVRTEADGAHFKAEGTADAVAALYEQLPGDEFLIEDAAGRFVFKEADR